MACFHLAIFTGFLKAPALEPCFNRGKKNPVLFENLKIVKN